MSIGQTWTRTERLILGIQPVLVGPARFGLVVITPPVSEPVTLDELKMFLRVDLTTEDSLITSLGIAARALVENHTARALMEQTLELHLDEAPLNDFVELPRAPLSSVTSIKSVALGTTTETVFALTNVTIDKTKTPAVLRLINGAVWPTSLRSQDSFIVRYVAGAPSASEVPAPLKEAIKMCVAAWFEQRGQMETGNVSNFADLSKIPAVAKMLMSQYRVRTL